ncbi:MAG: beta strand repeat-containing protein, partial [Fluviicola sp.]
MKFKLKVKSALTFFTFATLFLCVFSTHSFGQKRFWVGGSGDWTSTTHWSLTSGGPSGASVPTAADSVIFDALSSTAAQDTIISSNSIDTVTYFSASSAVTIHFNLNLTVRRNFIGSLNPNCHFINPVRTLRINAITFPTNFFTPNSTQIFSTLRLNATTTTGLSVTSNVLANNKVHLDNGVIDFNTFTLNAGTIISNQPTTDTRNFDLDSAIFVIKTDTLFLDSLPSLSRPKQVTFIDSTNAILNDNLNANYPFVEFNSRNSQILQNTSIDSLLINTSIYFPDSTHTLKITNGKLLSFDTLISDAACLNPLTISNSLAPALPRAQIQYTGTNDSISLPNIAFVNIAALDSLGASKHYVNYSDVTNSIGFTPNTDFYWIGNSGNWSDPAHWSKSSGGVAGCRIPQDGDVLIFDQNSFSANNHIVTVDTLITVGEMHWNTIDDTAHLFLQRNIFSDGDVSLDNKLHVFRDSIQYRLEFNQKANFSPDSSFFDCNLAINVLPVTDTVLFTSPLYASDSSSIYHISGRLNTNSETISAQAYLARNIDLKRIYLGASSIYLKDGWDSDSLNATYQVNAGTSHIYVGRSRDTNYFTTNNKVFNNLTFDYNPRKVGSVRGNFTCNDLTITPGSMIKFQAGRTITLDSLIINGGCNKFKIDTIQLPILETDTILVDTLSAITTVYQDTSTSNVFGFSPIPADTVFDYVYTLNFVNGDTLEIDTIRKIINRAAIIDTIIGSPNQYIYLDSITEYVINITTEIDTIGFTEGYNFGVDNDTLTGRQAVMLFSTVNGSQFTFSSPKVQNVYGVSIQDGRFLGIGAKTAFFSTNVSGNTGWTFNTSPSTTANYTSSASFCFGDTTHFTNTSTAFSGNFNDLIHLWDYDETIVLGDTNAYVFENAGLHLVKLTTYYTNSCSSVFIDSVTIHDPTLFGTMNQADEVICEGTSVQFNASAINDSLTFYQFYKNGVSLGVPSLVDSILVGPILDNDSISFVATLFGCPSEDTISYVFDVNLNPVTVLTSSDADTTICASTSVTMTASGANLYQFFLNNTTATGNLPGTTFIKNNLVDNDSVYVIGTNTSTGCKDTSGLLIFDVNPLPTTTLIKSIASNTICDGTSVTFTAGGAATYEFFVNGISTGAPSATNTFTTDTLNTGNVVSVVGISPLGCPRVAPSTYSFFVIPLPTAGLTVADADTSVCQGEAINFNATGGSTFEYFINGTSQGASGSSTFSSNSLANNDQISVVVSFSGCRDTSVVIPVEIRGVPTTNLVSDDANDTICQLQNVNFTATGATNYTFSINGTQVQASSTDNTYATTTLSNGSTITVLGESNNCFVSDQIVFGVLGIPNVNITSSDFDNLACQGDAITFNGSGAATYQLGIDGVYGAVQAASAFPTTLSTGTYAITIRGIGANGCTNISTNTISTTINPNPTVSILSNDANDTICTGTSIQFTGLGSTFYQFYVDNVSQTSSSTTSTYSNSNLTNGQQVFVVGTSLGCIGRSDTLTIGVNPIPVVSLTSTDVDNVFCAGSPVTYTAAGATNYEYFLNSVSQGAASPIATFNGSTLSAATYTLSVTGTTNGCSSSDAKNIVVNAIPTVNMSSSDADNQFCTGTNVTLTGSGASNYEFILNGTSTAPSNPISTFSSSSLTNGNTLFVIGTTPAGCIDSSATVTFSVNPTPVITETSSDVDNTICSGTSVTFTATGGNTYEFLVNGISQGPASATATFTTSTLTSGQ